MDAAHATLRCSSCTQRELYRPQRSNVEVHSAVSCWYYPQDIQAPLLEFIANFAEHASHQERLLSIYEKAPFAMHQISSSGAGCPDNVKHTRLQP